MTVAALRHRPRQAALVVALAAVVTAAAALGPLYARAVEQSVLRTVVATAAASERTLVVTSSAAEPLAPAELARTVRDEVPTEFGSPIGGADAPVLLTPADGSPARTRLTFREGICRHLTVTAGRCPRSRGELLMSSRAAGETGVRPGSTVVLSSGDPAEGGVAAPATVVGVYGGVDVSTDYWAGRGLAPARSGTGDTQGPPEVDDVFTTLDTLRTPRWPDQRSHVDYLLGAGGLALADLPALRAATEDVDAQAGTVGASARSDTAALLDGADRQREQAQSVIPLLAVQLAVLGVVVLAFVCAAAAEQRRPEIALARLRGHGATGAAGLLVRELGLLVLLGTAAGAGVGWAVAWLAAKAWLADGVALEARSPVALAVAGSLVAGLVAIVVAGLPTLRQPLTALLRRIPPRASALQVGAVEGAVAAAAVAGLVTALSGDGGPVALLAPGLLAIAGGLLLAQATIPSAGPLARAALRTGRLPWALAGLQIARRPALRRLIAIVTVACALLVFAVDAWSVADRNRQARAAVEAGAPVVLTVDAADPVALRQAVLDIDPAGAYATPVATVRSATEVGPVTTAVEGDAFRRIARWGPDTAPPSRRDLAALRPATVDPLPLPEGEEIRFRVTATYAEQEHPRPPGFLGSKQTLRLGVAVTPDRGKPEFLELGGLREGRASYTGRMECSGCELSGFTISRAFGDSYPVTLRLEVEGVTATADGGRPVTLDLGPATEDAWQVVPIRTLISISEVDPGPPLTILDEENTDGVYVRRGNVPAVTPALAAGSLPKPFRSGPTGPSGLVLAPNLAGAEHLYGRVERIPRVPRSGSRGVVADLQTLSRSSIEAGPQSTYAVWLAADDPAREESLRRELAGHGLQVVSRDTTARHEAAFAAEGAALALRLALLAGIVAVLLAAAVLVVGVATSGASRARDLAGLRLVGVPLSAVRASSVREHLVVAVLGVLAGSAIGLVAAQAALPEVPLFATGGTMPLDLTPDWGPVLVTVAGCLVLLAAVSVVVGRALAASAVPDRLRGSA